MLCCLGSFKVWDNLSPRENILNAAPAAVYTTTLLFGGYNFFLGSATDAYQHLNEGILRQVRGAKTRTVVAACS